MVGRVEEEGEEKNGTAIPAKDMLKQRCSGKEQRTKSEICQKTRAFTNIQYIKYW